MTGDRPVVPIEDQPIAGDSHHQCLVRARDGASLVD